MKDPKRIYYLCWILIIVLLFPFTDCDAQQKEMSVEDLTNTSTAVLYGKCSKIKSEWNENKSIIYTYITVVPEEYIKGNLGTEVVIAVPGGRVDDIIYEVSEMPVFTEGEEVFAFVWRNPSGKNLITGGSQGKLKIEKDIKTGKRMVKAKDSDSGDDSELLENFVAKVKGYVKN